MKKCNIVLSEKNDVMNVIRLLVPSSLLECDGCDNNYYHNYDESEVLIIMDFSAVYTNINEGIHVVFEWHNFAEQITSFRNLIDTMKDEYNDLRQTSDKLITERDENIDFMRDCIDEQIDIITQLRDDNSHKDSIIDELNNKIARLELTNKELNDKIGELTLQKSGYAYSNQVLLSRIGQYEQTVQIYRDRIESSEEGRQNFIKHANRMLRDKKMIIIEKNTEIDRLNDFISSLQRKIYEYREKYGLL